MMNIQEIFAPAMHRASRILSLMTSVDRDACVALHGHLLARLCQSGLSPRDAVYVLTNVTAEVMSFLDEETQRDFCEDIPELIDLAREMIEESRRDAP